MRKDVLDRFWSKVDKTGSCWVWTAKSKDWDGYGLFNYRDNGRKVQLRAHRLSWEIHNGRPPGNLYVCHHCDNPSCVNPAHLFVGTAGDNYRDCLSKGRYSPKGGGNAAAKLREGDVVKIRELYARGGVSQRELGEKFGVVQSAISSIVRGKHWSHVNA